MKAQAQEAVEIILKHEYGMLGNSKDEDKFFSVNLVQYQEYARELLVEENKDFN